MAQLVDAQCAQDILARRHAAVNAHDAASFAVLSCKDVVWVLRPAVRLLGIAAPWLPMLAMQTDLQLRAGMSCGPRDPVPFAGFALISGDAIRFLRRVTRAVSAVPLQ